MNVGKALAADIQRSRPPRSRSDEYWIVAVAEKVVYFQCAADSRIKAHLYLQLFEQLFVAIDDSVWETELGNSVTEHTADVVLAFENSHAVTVLRQYNGNGKPSGSRTDNGDALSVFWSAGRAHTAEVSIGNKALDIVKLNGRILFSQNAVTRALCLMIAHGSADNAHGIVFEKLLACLHDFVFLEFLNDLRYRRVYWAILHTPRLFAV